MVWQERVITRERQRERERDRETELGREQERGVGGQRTVDGVVGAVRAVDAPAGKVLVRVVNDEPGAVVGAEFGRSLEQREGQCRARGVAYGMSRVT